MSAAASPHEDRILDAGLELFIRHGFRRTTMGDIAEKADMSRPALYLVYRNKEEIFRGVASRLGEQLEALAGQRIASKRTLRGKLEAALKTWVVEPYKLISRSPEAGELHEIGFSFADDLRKRMNETFERQLIELLASSEETDHASIESAGTDLPSIATLIARSSSQLKRVVDSAADLERLLATMTQVNLAVLTGKPA